MIPSFGSPHPLTPSRKRQGTYDPFACVSSPSNKRGRASALAERAECASPRTPPSSQQRAVNSRPSVIEAAVEAGRPEIMDADAKQAWADAFEAPEFGGVPIANVVLTMRLTPNATKLFQPAKLSDEGVVDFSTKRIGTVPTMGRYMQNMHQLKIIKPAPWCEKTSKGHRMWAVKLGNTSDAVHVTGIRKHDEVAYLLNYLADLLRAMAPASGDGKPPLIRVQQFSVGNIHASYSMGLLRNTRLSLDDVRTNMSTGAVITHPDPLRLISMELRPTTKAVVNAIFSEKQHKTYTGFTFAAKASGELVGDSRVTIFASGSLLINGKSAPLIATVADMIINSYLPCFVKQQGA
jgi:hypothetical protein